MTTDAITTFLEGLKVGGPWTLVAILGGVISWLYRDCQKERRDNVDKLVGLATAQTLAITRLEATLSATKDALLSLERRLE